MRNFTSYRKLKVHRKTTYDNKYQIYKFNGTILRPERCDLLRRRRNFFPQTVYVELKSAKR